MTADRSRPGGPALNHLRRSPLAAVGAELAAASGPAVRLVELPFLTQLSLRVDPVSPAARRVADVLGTSLPSPGLVSGDDDPAALWLGPDEWLLVAPDGAAVALVDELRTAVATDPGSVLDVSAQRTTLEVAGPAAREVLASGVALDLHPRAFGPGRVAATLLARARVVLWQVDSAPSYRLLVGNSFSGYLADWLMDASLEPASRET